MRLFPAAAEHSRSIAEIYRQAFPESIALFFPRKPRARLLRLLELTFALLFSVGARGVLAQNDQGKTAGYLLYTTSQPGRAHRSLWRAGGLLVQMAFLLSPLEMGRLLLNQLLMSCTVRKTKKVPRPQATILSVAVHPAYQGQGLGTLLLGHALDQLRGQSVGLNVRANNPAGRRLYAVAGFEEWGSRRDLGGRWLMLCRRP